MNTNQFYTTTAQAVADYLFQELKVYPGQHYQIRTVNNGPRIINLAVTINPTFARKILSMGEQLSMAAGLDKSQVIRIERGSGGTLSLEIPKPKDCWFNIPVGRLHHRRGIKTVVGVDTDLKTAWLDFDEPTAAHCLVAGMTGSGKTNAQRLITYDLAKQNGPDELQVILVDTSPKAGLGWRQFANLPHLAHPIITDNQEAYKLFGWLQSDIRRRVTASDFTPKLFVGVDEIQELLTTDEMTQAVSKLAAIGREVGIHLLAATQNPVAGNLGDVSIKRNMARLVGPVDSADAARAAAGMKGSGAEMLTGPGDMLLVGTGRIRRLAVALLTDKDIARLDRVETVNRLDLDGFEDLTHVSEQANLPGRQPDDLEAEHLAYALAHPDSSQRAMYDEYRIGFTKIKRIKEFAQAVLTALEVQGYKICELQHCNELE